MANLNWEPAPIKTVNPLKSGLIGFIIGGGLTLVAVITAIGLHALAFRFLWLALVPLATTVIGTVFGMARATNATPSFQDSKLYHYRVLLETEDGDITTFKRRFVGQDTVYINEWLAFMESHEHETMYVFVGRVAPDNRVMKELRLFKADVGISHSEHSLSLSTIATA